MSDVQSTAEYRDVLGFPGYRVGDDGSVWSCRPLNGRGPLKTTYRQMSPVSDSHGRLFVNLGRGNKRFMQYVHHLVLEAFCSPRPQGCWALHHDDDPTNNQVENLYWGTRCDNARDACKNGKQINGERCHKAKFTLEEVQALRGEYAADPSPATTLRWARTKRVRLVSVLRIVRRETWKHVV